MPQPEGAGADAPPPELEVYKAMRSHELMLNEATSAFEHAAIAPLSLLNGGATVAFLTLLGAVANEKSKLSLTLGWGIAATAVWALGLVAAAVAARYGYKAQRAISTAHRIRRQHVELQLLANAPDISKHLLKPEPGEDPVGEREQGEQDSERFEYLQLVSIGCFVVGGVLAALSILWA